MPEPSKPEPGNTGIEVGATLKKKTYNLKYYAANRNELIKYARKYRKTEGYKANIIEYKRQYHIKNKDKINKKVREYYLNNRDEKLAYGKKWRADNKDKMKIYRSNHKMRLRLETFDAYGGSICVCCGEKEVGFLTIDHINNNGSEERREMNSRGGYDFYAKLRIKGFPMGYQVLCFNCNMAKGHFGYCPHSVIPESSTIPL